MHIFERKVRIAVILFGCIVLTVFCGTSYGKMDPFTWAEEDLKCIRDEKVRQLNAYFNKLHDSAKSAAEAPVLHDVFEIFRTYYSGKKKGDMPAEFIKQVEKLNTSFGSYYINNFYAFYDILFIDLDGVIVYTVRKEADMNRNLLQGKAAETPLGKCIASRPTGEIFVDFHGYSASGEPAAFFVEPLYIKGKHAGWAAFQCSINKINALFTSTGDVGRTVETFLVNDEGFMLTESHFEPDSTILKKRLSQDNIKAKFKAGRGALEIVDYRGKKALSSFEVVEFLKTRRLVVVKIDKDEVVTQEYRRHPDYYINKLLAYVQEQSPAAKQERMPQVRRDAIRVDMDEFAKGKCADQLQTWGISTCTGLLVAYPKRFAYLAHISNKDSLYGGRETNLLGQILKSMERYDISEIDKSGVRFTIIAPHPDTTAETVKRIVEEGFMLSQVHLMYHPQAESAEVVFECDTDTTAVQWNLQNGTRHMVQSPDSGWNVGVLLHRIMDTTY